MKVIFAPISVGELLDKISILNIKQSFATDPKQLHNILIELQELEKLKPPLNQQVLDLYVKLENVNLELWHIEDFKRNCEKIKNFNSDFIEAARNVYIKNDLRAKIKKQINMLTSSHIVEEKIY